MHLKTLEWHSLPLGLQWYIVESDTTAQCLVYMICSVSITDLRNTRICYVRILLSAPESLIGVLEKTQYLCFTAKINKISGVMNVFTTIKKWVTVWSVTRKLDPPFLVPRSKYVYWNTWTPRYFISILLKYLDPLEQKILIYLGLLEMFYPPIVLNLRIAWQMSSKFLIVLVCMGMLKHYINEDWFTTLVAVTISEFYHYRYRSA